MTHMGFDRLQGQFLERSAGQAIAGRVIRVEIAVDGLHDRLDHRNGKTEAAGDVADVAGPGLGTGEQQGGGQQGRGERQDSGLSRERHDRPQSVVTRSLSLARKVLVAPRGAVNRCG